MPDETKSGHPNNGQTRPVRALVLSGGGGRGAYEVGVAKACADRDFHFDWIIGTSTGALNATLMAQKEVSVLESVWRRISARDVYKLPNPGHLRRLIFGQQLGFFDTSPLEGLLRQHADLKKLKAGQTKVGFVTTDLCSLKTRVITSDDISSQEELIDVLMASSALPLLFPPRKLLGEGCWIDGGLVKNTPIQAAIRLGATEIYAVLVEPSSEDSCPTSLFRLIARLLEILLDHSARSGIAHVKDHNRMTEATNSGIASGTGNGWCLLEDRDKLVGDNANIVQIGTTVSSTDTNGTANDSFLKKVSLFIIKPQRQISGSLLEINPIVSHWLMKLGYDDIIRQCIAVD